MDSSDFIINISSSEYDSLKDQIAACEAKLNKCNLDHAKQIASLKSKYEDELKQKEFDVMKQSQVAQNQLEERLKESVVESSKYKMQMEEQKSAIRSKDEALLKVLSEKNSIKQELLQLQQPIQQARQEFQKEKDLNQDIIQKLQVNDQEKKNLLSRLEQSELDKQSFQQKLQKEILGFKDQLLKQEADKAAKHAQLQSAMKEIEDCQAKFKQYAQELNEKKTVIDTLQQQILKEKQKSALADNAKELQVINASLTQQIRDCEDELKKRQTQIEALEKVIADQKTIVQKHIAMKNENENTIAQLTTLTDTQKQELNNLRNTLKEVSEANKVKDAKISNLEQNIKDLNKNLKEMEQFSMEIASNSNQDKQNKEYLSSIQQLHQDKDELLNKIQSLQDSVNTYEFLFKNLEIDDFLRNVQEKVKSEMENKPDDITIRRDLIKTELTRVMIKVKDFYKHQYHGDLDFAFRQM